MIETTRVVIMPTKINSPIVIEIMLFGTMGIPPDSRGFSSQNQKDIPESTSIEAPVVVGLGANLGFLRETFSLVLTQLKGEFDVRGVSSLYRSDPIGPRQPDFLNAAVLLECSRELDDVLGRLQELESELGRVRSLRWGPRVIDLDILWAGTRICNSARLTVPHIQLRRRAFALRPLLDLIPGARDPRDGVPYRSFLEDVSEQVIYRMASEGWDDDFSG